MEPEISNMDKYITYWEEEGRKMEERLATGEIIAFTDQIRPYVILYHNLCIKLENMLRNAEENPTKEE